jgi:hypothetical protein
MRIKLSNKVKRMASALLIVLILGGILCLFVIYYLALIEQQNKLSVRSQAWNIAIAISEAGIEDGLQAVNSGATPSTADNWQLLADGRYWRTNTLADGNRYEVGVHLGHREIVSRGYVVLPAMAANTPSAFFAAAGVNVNDSLVSRAVRVRYLRGGFYLGALIARHKINLKGNGALTDSFDSESLWESDFGHYNPAVYVGDKGDIASNEGVVATIGVGNAEIYGKAHVGAEGSVTINQGWVGPHPKGAAGGYADGWVLQDANFTFPDTWLPYTSGLPLGGPQDVVTVKYDITKAGTNSTAYPEPAPWSGVTTSVTYTTSVTLPNPVPPGTVTNYLHPQIPNCIHVTGYTWPTYHYAYSLYTTNTIYSTNHYDHVITSGDYLATDLHGSTIALGEARLVLPDGLTMSGNDGITVAPGGSLEVYAGGSSCTIGGNGINNQSGFAKDFILECTPSVTTFTFNGNGEFIGVLVAPEANMTLNGAGSGNNDFIGCIMMSSITMNGHYSFHYDEALARLSQDRRVLVTSWDEIP